MNFLDIHLLLDSIDAVHPEIREKLTAVFTDLELKGEPDWKDLKMFFETMDISVPTSSSNKKGEKSEN